MPLTPKQFADALRKGSGRAWLHLRDHGDDGVEDALIEAVTHNLSFDRQTEGSRCDWLMGLLGLLPDASRYRAAVIEAFAQSRDVWDLELHSGLLLQWAEGGDVEAATLLRQSLNRLPLDALENVGVRLLQLDGIDALLPLARRVGGAKEAYWLRDYAESEFGANAIALVIGSSPEPDLRAFDAAKSGRVSIIMSSRPRTTWPDFLSALDDPGTKPRIAALEFARTAKPDELELVVDHIESGGPHLTAMLHVGRLAGLPRVPDNLIALAESVDPEFADAAIESLAQFRTPEVLALGRRMVARGIWGGIRLLADADVDELRALVPRLATVTEAETIHRIGLDVVALFRGRENAEASLLLWMIEATPCSFRRHSAIRDLVEANAVPFSLLAEALHDCNDETRELIASYPNRPTA